MEIVAEWDERYSPELQKLYKEKDVEALVIPAMRKKVFALDDSIKRVYAVRPVKPGGKDLPKGKRVMQAMFRFPKERSGFDPDIVVPGGGLAARGGKEGIMLRMVSSS